MVAVLDESYDRVKALVRFFVSEWRGGPYNPKLPEMPFFLQSDFVFVYSRGHEFPNRV